LDLLILPSKPVMNPSFYTKLPCVGASQSEPCSNRHLAREGDLRCHDCGRKRERRRLSKPAKLKRGLATTFKRAEKKKAKQEQDMAESENLILATAVVIQQTKQLEMSVTAALPPHLAAAQEVIMQDLTAPGEEAPRKKETVAERARRVAAILAQPAPAVPRVQANSPCSGCNGQLQLRQNGIPPCGHPYHVGCLKAQACMSEGAPSCGICRVPLLDAVILRFFGSIEGLAAARARGAEAVTEFMSPEHVVEGYENAFPIVPPS